MALKATRRQRNQSVSTADSRTLQTKWLSESTGITIPENLNYCTDMYGKSMDMAVTTTSQMHRYHLLIQNNMEESGRRGRYTRQMYSWGMDSGDGERRRMLTRSKDLDNKMFSLLNFSGKVIDTGNQNGRSKAISHMTRATGTLDFYGKGVDSFH
ncbi:MAG: hypothetical protein Q9188_005060 [Gyalolechia gomerana]